MASSDFDKLLVALKQIPEESRLMKLLIDVRNRVEWPRDEHNIKKLRDRKCFRTIVSSLSASKKCIVNVALSILGNCCLDPKCSNHLVTQYAILPNLHQVLKNYPESDSINGRVFRIVGNLCLHFEKWSMTIIEKKPQIVIHIVKFLTDVAKEDNYNKISNATVVMGVRALRELLNGTTLQPLVKTFKVLKVVGMLLIKYGIEWQEEKKNETVLLNIIQLLVEYSNYCYYSMITELRTTEKGDSIVQLSKVVMIAPKQVVKIIKNFLRISHLNSELPIGNIFDAFFEVLRDDTSLEDFTPNYEVSIKCVCQLLDDPGVRSSEKSREIISVLINVLRQIDLDSKKKIQCCILLLSVLNLFKFDLKLMEEQVKCNIVDVITEKLELIVGSSRSLTLSHKKLRSRVPGYESFFKGPNKHYMGKSSRDKNLSPSCRDGELAISCRGGISPQSLVFPSPSSSPCVSILFASDSDDYSPICSEVDSDEYPVYVTEDGVERNSNFDFDSENPIIITMMGVKRELILQLTLLLKIIVLLRPFVYQLKSVELISALVKCSGLFDCSNAQPVVNLIIQLLQTPGCLLMLMQTDFPMLVREMMQHQHRKVCLKCTDLETIADTVLFKMSELAMSEVVEGEIAHNLLRGEEHVKQQLVLAIPYLVRPQWLLAEFMLECKALNLFMKLLCDVSMFQSRSIKALCVIPETELFIIKSKMEMLDSPKDDNSSQCLQTVDSSKEITFKLDDGSTVKVNISRFAKISDFFSCLFHGSFRESGENEITLRYVDNNSFKWLLKLDNIMLSNDNILHLDADLVTQLDLIVLCDRFLMKDHYVYLTRTVCEYFLTPNNVVTVYKWSIESGLQVLRYNCICVALLIPDYAERLEVLHSLFDLGYFDELVTDIKEVIIKALAYKINTRKRKRKFDIGFSKASLRKTFLM